MTSIRGSAFWTARFVCALPNCSGIGRPEPGPCASDVDSRRWLDRYADAGRHDRKGRYAYGCAVIGARERLTEDARARGTFASVRTLATPLGVWGAVRENERGNGAFEVCRALFLRSHVRRNTEHRKEQRKAAEHAEELLGHDLRIVVPGGSRDRFALADMRRAR